MVFDSAGKVLASTADFSDADLAVYTNAFNSRDATVGAGLTISGVNYEVHRYAIIGHGIIV